MFLIKLCEHWRWSQTDGRKQTVKPNGFQRVRSVNSLFLFSYLWTCKTLKFVLWNKSTGESQLKPVGGSINVHETTLTAIEKADRLL
jgi:hypothetical protein